MGCGAGAGKEQGRNRVGTGLKKEGRKQVAKDFLGKTVTLQRHFAARALTGACCADLSLRHERTRLLEETCDEVRQRAVRQPLEETCDEARRRAAYTVGTRREPHQNSPPTVWCLVPPCDLGSLMCC